MPSGETIQRQMAGAWRLMLGRRDGLALLDISADGFWNSFFAMVVAVPALGLGWVSLANELGGGAFGSRLGIFAMLAFTDLVAWLAPIVLLGLLARRFGIAQRFVPYVVASNWGSALLIWFLVPLSLVDLVWTGSSQILDSLSLVLFLVTMVLSWRLTNAALGMGAMTASWVFGLVLCTSLAVLVWLPQIMGFQPG